MAQVVLDGVTYDDGEYIGFCYRCKCQVYFIGTVRMTELNRVLATGPCDVCTRTVTKVLVYN